MSTRCQPGDLALVTRGYRENVGKLVRCVRPASPGELIQADGTPFGIGTVRSDRPMWIVDQKLVVGTQEEYGRVIHSCLAADKWLMPIRPERDEDHLETELQSDLQCLGRFTEEHAWEDEEIV